MRWVGHGGGAGNGSWHAEYARRVCCVLQHAAYVQSFVHHRLAGPHAGPDGARALDDHEQAVGVTVKVGTGPRQSTPNQVSNAFESVHAQGRPCVCLPHKDVALRLAGDRVLVRCQRDRHALALVPAHHVLLDPRHGRLYNPQQDLQVGTGGGGGGGGGLGRRVGGRGDGAYRRRPRSAAGSARGRHCRRRTRTATLPTPPPYIHSTVYPRQCQGHGTRTSP